MYETLKVDVADVGPFLCSRDELMNLVHTERSFLPRLFLLRFPRQKLAASHNRPVGHQEYGPFPVHMLLHMLLCPCIYIHVWTKNLHILMYADVYHHIYVRIW